MSEIGDISELERLVDEGEPEPKPDNSALQWSKYAYNAAVAVIDLITGYTVWQLTFWYYGVLWVLAGAVVFFLHQHNWERPGNNESQVSISAWGIGVSVASIVVMGATSGSLWILGVKTPWSEVGIVIASVVLYSFHAIQLARYYFLDDNFAIQRAIARAKAQADKKVQIARAGGEVVRATKEALKERNVQYQKHGDRGAVDAAMAKIEGKKPQQNNQPAPKMQYAADVKQEQPKQDFTDPPRK